MSLLFAFTTSLICLAIHAAITWDGMPLQIIPRLFHKLGRLIDPCNKSGAAMAFIQKPLYNCLPCMGSVYTILHWIYCGYSLHWHLLVMILATVGINSLIALLIRLIESLEDIHSELLRK